MEDFNYETSDILGVSEYSFDTDVVITSMLEEEYLGVLDNLKKYLKDDQEENIIGTMIEFCHDYNLSLDLLADIINTDLEFKESIHEYCTSTNIFRV